MVATAQKPTAPKRRRKRKLEEPVTPGIHIQYVALSKLMEWPGNPKEHDLEGLGESFERFGFVEPVVIDEGTGRIAVGHGRREKLLGWKVSGHPPPDRIQVRGNEWFVPVLRGVTFRNEHEAEAYLVAGNQLTINGGYNATALAAMLARHKDDAHGIGWKPEQIEDLIERAQRASQRAMEEAALPDEPVEQPTSRPPGPAHTCPGCGMRIPCDSQ